MYCVPRVSIQMCRTLVKEQATFLTRTSIVRLLHPLAQHCSTVSNEQTTKKIIYTGELKPQVMAVKIFSMTTSALGIIAQPVLAKKAAAVGTTPLIIAAYGFLGFFTFATPVLFHMVTKRYITEILHDSKTGEYTASTIGFFMQRKHISFTPDDVKVPDVGGMFTTFIVKGVPLFVEPSTFTDMSHYGRIMGFDKPLDLKLGSITKPVNQK